MANERSYDNTPSARGANRFTRRQWHSHVMPAITKMEAYLATVPGEYEKKIQLEEAASIAKTELEQAPEDKDAIKNYETAVKAIDDHVKSAEVRNRMANEHRHSLHQRLETLQRGCRVPLRNFPDYHRTQVKIPKLKFDI